MLEALGPGGLLLVRDTAESEGRSLLRALVSEAAARAEQVLVVLLEVTQEEFQRGLSPSVRERLLFRDLSGDPLGAPSPNCGAAAPGPSPPSPFGGSGGSGPAPAHPGGAPQDPRSPPEPEAAQGPPERAGGPGGDPHPPPRRLLGGAPPARPLPKFGGGGGGRGAQKGPKRPKFGPLPPDFSPGAVGGRAGGEGGPDPPVPAQDRPRGAPRGPRGPRRGPGPLNPPRNSQILGENPQIRDPNKGAAPPPPCRAHFGPRPPRACPGSGAAGSVAPEVAGRGLGGKMAAMAAPLGPR
ncbi:elongator complex protein 5 [Poecile atricapillus]|uniref:elongator complex protein 5 n=1 Tax=Poecile atricapillus TaxID=48891 RepID=UPI0027381B98|nr:elongator complex protein 5 [Poecile atricapillus]